MTTTQTKAILADLKAGRRLTAIDAHFDGETYVASRDKVRLKGQLLAVFEVMKDGKEHSLHGIALSVGAPEASISARLRDLRKPKFGGFEVRRRNLGGGRWTYRIGDQHV